MIAAASFDFLRALAANNDKAWFEAHRADYDSAVRQPVAALVVSVTTLLTRRELPLGADPKRATFRIHRDVRFSKDKRPYKTHVGSVWHRPGGSREGGTGILYFHLEPGASFTACAFYMPDPEALDAIRERIRVYPGKWSDVLSALARARLELATEDRLTRMPKGFEDLKETPIADSLRLKSFLVRRPLTNAQVHGAALPRRIADLAEHALPLLEFGWAAIDEARTA